MTAVLIELRPPRPADSDTIEVIPDLDVLSESNRCSCAASDDNPY
jgi:hypothetical protein